jgi:hypothetical protein
MLHVRAALIKIAERFDALAAQREQERFLGWAAGDE